MDLVRAEMHLVLL